ncbi:hypothetical protein SISSUDRAFT_1032485 [Sistotremastrum suecicum HHB10207 ss-3]|uniref:Uncharacterized protein n=1 Tax=Sistotremastrum suecicum HHB10207 ss-3 TaxID=1314776 RepID=A0A166EHC7_9AGAM|nr:hypothetical protein SISSUDRAFT_1032485 [Sistotremastrum suecicum HHB10207 ss-3]
MYRVFVLVYMLLSAWTSAEDEVSATGTTHRLGHSADTIKEDLRIATTHRNRRNSVANWLRLLLRLYLSEYGDAYEIEDIMEDTASIITGPGVLALVSGIDPLRAGPRLVVVTRSYQVFRFRNFFIAAGYTLCDQASMVPPMAPFLSVESDPCIASVTQLSRTRDGLTRCVDIYGTSRYPEDMVPTFNATPYMNYFYSNGFAMLYPQMTMDRCGLIRSSDEEQYMPSTALPLGLHGYDLSDDVFDLARYREICPKLSRTPGDDFFLELEFRRDDYECRPILDSWESCSLRE